MLVLRRRQIFILPFFTRIEKFWRVAAFHDAVFRQSASKYKSLPFPETSTHCHDIPTQADIKKSDIEKFLLPNSKNALVVRHQSEGNTPEWSKLIPVPNDTSWWQKLGGSNSWWSTVGFQTATKNVDVSVVWESARGGAEELVKKLEQFVSYSPLEQLHATNEVQLRLELFKSIFEKKSSSDRSSKKYKARIVATRGYAGTKCPRYHTDWVPLRLICAPEGPGVVFVDNEQVHNLKWRSIINNSEELDSLKFNQEVERNIPESAVEHSKCGESVLLVGKAWEDKKLGLQSAVHCSPYLNKDDARVLLTVDVLDFQKWCLALFSLAVTRRIMQHMKGDFKVQNKWTTPGKTSFQVIVERKSLHAYIGQAAKYTLAKATADGQEALQIVHSPCLQQRESFRNKRLSASSQLKDVVLEEATLVREQIETDKVDIVRHCGQKLFSRALRMRNETYRVVRWPLRPSWNVRLMRGSIAVTVSHEKLSERIEKMQKRAILNRKSNCCHFSSRG